MANGMIKVMLIGNATKDPEIKFTNSGTPVCNLRLACTERAKGKDGNWEDRTEFVTVVCFGKTAENCGQYLGKGRQAFVDGRLQTREWTDKDGNKKYATEVVANQVLFLGSGKDQAQAPAAAPGKQAPADDDIAY